MKLGAKVFGAVAGLLLLFLAVGLVLPGHWDARSQALLPAPPPVVFSHLNRVDRWMEWNPLPDADVEIFGPPEGSGAGLRWDDPRYGAGEMHITESDPPRSLTYEVRIEEGGVVIHGSMTLVPDEEGTLLRWREEGDFGWNPLLGYTALGMDESQARAMEERLEILRGLLKRQEGTLNPP